MANNAITNGQIKLGHVYHFRNKAYPKYALNVWSSSSYPQAKLSNVCLWEYDETDIAQKWVIKNSTPSYIQPLKGSSSNLYLDRYTGTGAGAGINAHLYTPSDTSLFDIQTASQDSVKIKVADKNLYLTAYGGTNGKRTGKTAKSEGNVFFAANSNSPTQEWIPVDDSSSGGETGGETGGDGDTYTINGKTIPLSEWPVGSYWTTDGKPYEYGKNSSKEFTDGAIQCAGFAKYVYEQLWGNYKYGQKVAAVTLEGTSEDFKRINVGARINCDRRKKKIESDKDFATSIGNHSMILLSKTSSGIVVYECNYDFKCGIGMRTITYRNFYLEYMNIKDTSYTP